MRRQRDDVVLEQRPLQSAIGVVHVRRCERVSGQVIPLTGDTGAFWFFSSSNVEVVIKVLNGCGVEFPLLDICRRI